MWTLVITFAILAFFAGSGFYLTFTGSLPSGIYKKTDASGLRHGSIILFCPPDNKRLALGKKRDYTRESSTCAAGTAPLGKIAVGLPGDTVRLDSTGIWVNHRRVPNSAPPVEDSKGRPLPPKYGTFHLGEGEFYTYSHYVPEKSFDSRFFGPVENIISVLEPFYVSEPLPELRMGRSRADSTATANSAPEAARTSEAAQGAATPAASPTSPRRKPF